jgi:hypothetical protein
MKNIIYTNSRGQSINLGNENPFILTKIEGTGAVNINIKTQKSPFQDGVSYLGNTLAARPLSIEIMILAGSIEEMVHHRRTISKVFNPKLDEGVLTYELGGVKRQIKAVPEFAPIFPDANDFEDVMQPGLIQLYCPNPLWLDEHITSQEIVTWIGGMSFPLSLGTAFSTAGATQKNLINSGDVETSVTLEITGTATNPKVTNKTTGEYIKVNRTLTADDTLIITTAFGNKRVEQNGVNVFNYIDIDSTFFDLEVGDNIIELTTDDVNDNASIKITYYNRYIGV